MNLYAEIEVMRAVCGELDKLYSVEARQRVLRFLLDRYIEHPVPLPEPGHCEVSQGEH